MLNSPQEYKTAAWYDAETESVFFSEPVVRGDSDPCDNAPEPTDDEGLLVEAARRIAEGVPGSLPCESMLNQDNQPYTSILSDGDDRSPSSPKKSVNTDGHSLPRPETTSGGGSSPGCSVVSSPWDSFLAPGRVTDSTRKVRTYVSWS